MKNNRVLWVTNLGWISIAAALLFWNPPAAPKNANLPTRVQVVGEDADLRIYVVEYWSEYVPNGRSCLVAVTKPASYVDGKALQNRNVTLDCKGGSGE